PGAGFSFSGGTYGPAQQINLTEVAKGFLDLFSITLPASLPPFVLSKLDVSFDTNTKTFTFDAASTFDFSDKPLDIGLTILLTQTSGAYTGSAKGNVTIGGQAVTADFTSSAAGK